MINIPPSCIHVERLAESEIPGTNKFVCCNGCGYARYIHKEGYRVYYRV